jgi:hypothetical protein
MELHLVGMNLVKRLKRLLQNLFRHLEPFKDVSQLISNIFFTYPGRSMFTLILGAKEFEGERLKR